ncbi:MAG TPA: hypothetical protein VFG68_19400 [Fimbriiglobus sp.]|nr:hypothetical protein [Fimbriiglobus sp.]
MNARVRWVLVLFTALPAARECSGDQPTAEVVPAVWHNSFVVAMYPVGGGGNHIRARSLNNVSITVDVRRYTSSLFPMLSVRESTLYLSTTSVELGGGGTSQTCDYVHAVSADGICGARLLHVDAAGKPFEFTLGEPAPWARLRPSPDRSGKREPDPRTIVHTAVIPHGAKALRRYELVRTRDPKRLHTVYTVRVTRLDPIFNPAEKRWSPAKATEVGEFEVDFSDPFLPYETTEGIFLVTRRGTVYHIPDHFPPTDKPAVVWGKDQPRISYVVTDTARTGVHYLFGQDEKQKWFYAILSPKLSPIALDRVVISDQDRADPIGALTSLVGQLRVSLRQVPGNR